MADFVVPLTLKLYTFYFNNAFHTTVQVSKALVVYSNIHRSKSL
jgi:hypothetical protein